jgi:hypothetical protein
MKKLIAWVEQRSWMKKFVLPIVAIAPTSALAFTRQNKDLSDWFDQHRYVQAICAFWGLVPIVAAYFYETYKPRTPLSVRQLSYLIEVLGRIVGKKVERLAGCLKSASKRRRKAKELFDEITHPEIQMAEIVAGIWQLFHSTSSVPDAKFRVSLARMGQVHIEVLEAFYPPDWSMRSPVEKLRIDQSGFSTAKRTKKIVVVSDLVTEATAGSRARFVVTRPDLKDESGSMICFPVEETVERAIPFVLCVCVDQRNYFTADCADVYEDLLRPFAQRIALEYCLEELKKKTK